MKNYLIKGLHRIKSTIWWPGSDRSWEGDLYPFYEKMNQLSKDSFFHNLAGDWSLVNLISDATDVNHVFRQQFRAIWDIWSTEPCKYTILWLRHANDQAHRSVWKISTLFNVELH